MFDSGVTAKAFIDEIKMEVDAAPDIYDATYYRFIDECEQLLYSEIIRETLIFTPVGESAPGFLSFEYIETTGDKVRYEDIYAVYAGDVQLVRATPAGIRTFPDSYSRIGETLYIKSENKAEINIYFYVRPKLKTRPGGENDTIKLPIEWLPIIGAKVRGEAYKLVNEDYAAAKWLADYNALIEQFKQYIAARAEKLGV
ncbi:MAG: hypothetical protein J1F63_08395 [Oscillospiraceae bacterium]|nr:hypothetical protein [Oscillospiraceae bacterium]